MAFIRLARFPGAGSEHFDALAAALRHAPVPAARLLFAAGSIDGGWQVVQVWSSRAELEEFNRNHLLPALAALGPSGFPTPPAVTDFSTEVMWWSRLPAPTHSEYDG